MKRTLYLLLIVVLLALQACGGGQANDSASDGRKFDPMESNMGYDPSLAGSALNDVTPPTSCPPATDENAAAFADQIINAVNQERAKNSLGALTSNSQLTQAAQAYAWGIGCDIASDPFSLIAHFGYNYSSVSEGEAYGDYTPEKVASLWTNDVLNSSFTEIGIGYVYNPNGSDKHYWVMMLAAPQAGQAAAPAPSNPESGSGTGSEQTGSGTGSEQTGSGTGSEQTGSGTGSEQSGSDSSKPAGCAASASNAKAAELGAEVIRLTNEERAKEGLPPLTSNPELIKAAQGHAWDVACNNLYATGDPHTGSDGSKLKDRIERTQYPTMIGSSTAEVGENIAAGQDTPASAVDAWMKSTHGHRENILSKSFTEIGIGYVYNPDGTHKHYWVMVLGRPPFVLTSSAFNEGAGIPNKYADTACSGENYSPPLSWTGAPSGTKSFVLLLDGPDKVHWVQFNIPSNTTSLPEFIGGPSVGVKGKNSWGTLGYTGPCTSPGDYVFSLFPVNMLLTLPEGATDTQVWDIVQTHSLLQPAKLTGKK